MEDPTETIEWRDIPGYSGYQVSNTGRVRSLDRYLPTKGGAVCLHHGKELTPKLTKFGYHEVQLTGGKCTRVHQLVLLAFVGPKPFEGAVGAHGDGVRTNNCAENLRWTTQKDNQADRKKHGTHIEGASHYYAKLTQAAVDEMRADKTTPHTIYAERYGMTRFSIERVRNGVGYGGQGRVTPRRPPPTQEELAKIQELRGILSQRKLAAAMGMTVNRLRWALKHRLRAT